MYALYFATKPSKSRALLNSKSTTSFHVLNIFISLESTMNQLLVSSSHTEWMRLYLPLWKLGLLLAVSTFPAAPITSYAASYISSGTISVSGFTSKRLSLLVRNLIILIRVASTAGALNAVVPVLVWFVPPLFDV